MRLVQRREVDEAFEFVDDLAVDRDWCREKLAAVHDAMADRRQVPAFLRLLQPLEQEVQAGLVLGFLAPGELEGDLVLAGGVAGDQPRLGADTVDLPGNGGRFAQAPVQFEKGELDRG